jgi:hypothetical protein
MFSFCTQHLDGPDARAQAVAVELLWAVASTLLPFGWTLVTGQSVIEKVVGWILWLIPFSISLHLFWRWSAEKSWVFSIRLTGISIASACMLGVAIASILAALQPTFFYFVPGLLTADNLTRTYGLQFRGDEPFYNVAVSVTDRGAMTAARSRNDELSIHYLRQPLMTSQELDPRHQGLIRWYTYKPFSIKDESLEFNIETRTIDIDEELIVHQDIPYTFPAYYLHAVDLRNSKVLLDCISDSRYTKFDPSKASLSLCCGDLYPPEGVYASCASTPTRVVRWIKRMAAWISG